MLISFSEFNQMFGKMYDAEIITTQAPITTTEATETTMAQAVYSPEFDSFEKWKSYMSFVMYFKSQKLIERINNGERIFHRPKTTAQAPTITTAEIPEETLLPPYFPRFG